LNFAIVALELAVFLFQGPSAFSGDILLFRCLSFLVIFDIQAGQQYLGLGKLFIIIHSDLTWNCVIILGILKVNSISSCGAWN
jgi:hypothetical protein